MTSPLSISGTPSLTLATMPASQLQERYVELRTFLCRNNFLSRQLRASPDPATRKQERLAANERVRIQRIARQRGIPLPQLTANEIARRLGLVDAGIQREPQTGDRVIVKYRDPRTGNVMEEEGEIIRAQWSRYIGVMYFTHFSDGRVLPLDRSTIVRILEETH